MSRFFAVVRVAFAKAILVAVSTTAAIAERTITHAELERSKPGQILRIMPLTGGGPEGTKAYRIIYRSVGVDDEPVSVSGALFLSEDDPPEGGRPVIAWAHPTTGVSGACAPSRLTTLANKIPGLERLMRDGYAVVATDYVGLGSGGPHPYLHGRSQARAIIDAVRAVRPLRDVRAKPAFTVWGHSQGGHAALFVGEHAPEYAPELDLVGVVAVAPPTDLVRLFEHDRGTLWGNVLSAMTLYSWSGIFGIPVDDIVEPRALASFQRVANDCMQTLPDLIRIVEDGQSIGGNFFKKDPTREDPWRSLLVLNSPGHQAIAAPVLVLQGEADDIVDWRVTRDYVHQLCAKGSRVTFSLMRGTGHAFAAETSVGTAIGWMHDRFLGRPAKNDC